MAVESTMLPLGTRAPAFELPDADGKIHSLDALPAGQPLLVAFICNHCPFVRHIRAEFARFAREYQARGVQVVAIASNDIEAYPQDGPEGMKEEARSAGYTFPYLLDESQAVAKACKAARICWKVASSTNKGLPSFSRRARINRTAKMPSATAAGTLNPVETSVRIAGQGMSASVTCCGSVST